MDGPSPRRKRLILATLCLALFMAMLDNVVVGNALPRISADLGAGMSGLQWVMEGYSLVYAALLLAGGTLGDRFGRRRFFLVGLAVFTGGSAACALAGSLGLLVTGRALQGIGAAALTPQSLAILRTTFSDDQERGRAIGTWSGVSALGLALGPAIGGPLVSAFGWASAFWINVPVGLAALVLGMIVVPVTPGQVRQPGSGGPLRRWDAGGFAAGAAGLAATVYALVEGPVRGWTSGPVLGAAGTAAVCLAAFVPFELAAPSPMLDLRLFGDRVFAGAALSGFVVSFGMFGVLTYLGLYMQDVLGWSPAGAGFASLPCTGVIMLVSPVASRLAMRFGPRVPLVAGLLSCAVGVAGLSHYGVGASYADFWWVLPMIGAGMGLSFSPISITVMNRVPVRRAGMASATTNTSREVGGVAGIAVLGALITARLGALLPDRLAAAQVPAGAAQSITHVVTTGGAGGLSRAGGLPRAIRDAVDTSFTGGLHVAMLAAAVFLTLGAGLVAVMMRPEQQVRLPPPPGEQPGGVRRWVPDLYRRPARAGGPR